MKGTVKMKDSPLYEIERAFRREVLLVALEGAAGSRTRAAESLGLQRTYFLRMLRALDLQDGAGRPGGVRREAS